ncbi:MAG: DEAD/DEAH box helicase [Candidatus Gastranaerophilaceae bacterium]
MNIIRGSNSNPQISSELIDTLEKLDIEGTLYLGFPIISVDDEINNCDAMLISDQKGIVVFDFNNRNYEGEELENIYDKYYLALKSKLTQHIELTTKEGRERKLDVPIEIMLFGYNSIDSMQFPNIIVATKQNLYEQINNLDNLDPKYIRPLKAAIDSVKTIKPRKKRTEVAKKDSKGAILKIIEKEIANLDKWQQEAAIETPEGPQRIRGLAGSGKTVVIARKAAYLHGQNPDWNIIITYNTRSLYQQLKELIRRFYYDQCYDEPNWDKIKIIPAWGGQSEGLYSIITQYYNTIPMNFSDAKAKYGYMSAFEGVCNEFLAKIHQNNLYKEPLFDAVLIDEAQDLPQSFFEIIYIVTKQPKRIIWAYDELQNLGGYSMSSPEELFGKDKQTNLANVSLNNSPNEPKQDIILPVCYRNTKWALSTAHALGFGAYRKKGLVQLFKDADLWSDIGYQLIEGDFDKADSTIKLKRKDECTPSFFNNYINPDEAIKFNTFKSKIEQYNWLIKDIKNNLKNEEIEEDDILVILPEPLTGRQEASILIEIFMQNDLKAHMVGITSNKETVFIEKSIAISGIHRAKGNEAPLVYILNSQYCYDGIALSRKRNILFTAITRSRAWVNVLGYNDNENNDNMTNLEKEFLDIKNNDYNIQFKLPTDEELYNLRQIHRDRSKDSIERLEKAKRYKKYLEELPEDEKKLIDIEDLF